MIVSSRDRLIVNSRPIARTPPHVLRYDRTVVVEIDVREERVRIGDTALLGKWVELYALLAITRVARGNEHALVTAQELSTVGSWRNNQLRSVGKQVCRHLDWLSQRGLRSAVKSRETTKAWQLGVRAKDVRFVPDRAAVKRWIDARRSVALRDGEWEETLRAVVEASVALQEGDAERVLDRLRPRPQKTVEPALRAWRALLRGRAAYQHDQRKLLDSLRSVWEKRADAPARTVAARLHALVALRERFGDPAAELSSLDRLATHLEGRGDAGGLGSVLNVMGLLARRAGDASRAAALHLRAAALFGIVGDYPSLQAALYNLANCRRENLLAQSLLPDDTVFGVLDLCRLICRRFAVGDDSAQAEICGARWAFEAGQIDRARSYLADAAVILRRAEATFDQGCFLLLRAQIEIAAPTGASHPARDAGAAERHFEQAGDLVSAAAARRLKERCRTRKVGSP